MAKEVQPEVEDQEEADEVAHEDLPTFAVLNGKDGFRLKVKFLVPNSMGLRYEVYLASARNEGRAVCAALGLCSAALQKQVRWQHDVCAFGAGVMDYLLSKGVPYLTILRAGRIAWATMTHGLTLAEEVAETEDFSEAGQET